MKLTLVVYLFALLSILFLIVTEQWLAVSYLHKTLIKISLFFVIPLIFIRLFTSHDVWQLLRWHPIHPMKKLAAVIIGVSCIAIILTSYYLIGFKINWSIVMEDTVERLGISARIFPFVALYITFVNSFLEEWFFRGFLHIKLISYVGHWPASILSASLFAFYHLAVFLSWFDWTILVLCLVSLFTVGVILNELNRNHRHIYASWIVHILADVGVMLVGFHLFYGG
ncbi:CPBP family intramembrane glutamic endopeptidase [Jeotgalibacillus soli]|uniref:CAAX prenyl protease 2/Lysostaphin resistance protein A-like domain-containing protein n=1 Tax=Jeotgalibacillus soli TaxID=889306 RepID=A0A0C2VS05_9BACL|nr:type II CAAX endopeptidase family protein [Jeotgalibacillus soli]KIL46773.1 hypothetical protein KP78_18910 [Jeotgalibacillus soli]